MSFIKFIFSKTFLTQLVLAVLAVVVIAFLALQWLEYSTNQNQRIKVPELTGLSLDVVEQRLEEMDLRYEILDSANYNPDYPRFSVIDQIPAAGKKVKEDRKIYLTINPSGYRKVEIPELVGKTRRQVEPTLKALGFEIGNVTYKARRATDEVLELRHKGRKLEKGDELQITSVIDMVLGDGSQSYKRGEETAEEGEELIDEETETND
jgi:beta-lactam-binding protein with PASTA domain